MFGIATTSLQMYGAIALAAVIGVFLVIFKMRGMKIDGLEKTLASMVAKTKANYQAKVDSENARKASSGFQETADKGAKDKSNAGKSVSDLVDSTIVPPISVDQTKEQEVKVKSNEAFLDRIRVGL